jgi:lysophospholipase L1-like esterase
MKRLLTILCLLFSLAACSQSGYLGIVTPDTLPSARSGQTAYIGGGGTSISMGYYDGADHTATSYQRYAGDYIGKSWAAVGHSGYRTDQILGASNSLYNSEVISAKFTYTIIEGGVNDVAQGVAQATIIANLKTMIDLVAADGGIAVYLPILPWSNGTNTQNGVVDAINAEVISYMQSTYPAHIVADARATVGKFRSGGTVGNLWDIKAEYNNDGVHFNVAGYQAIGNYIGAAIMSSL